MAELIVVSPVIKILMNKLASELFKELELLGGVQKDIKKLKSTLSTINGVLEDAVQRSISDKSLCDWLKKLRDTAYDADDVVDEYQFEALKKRIDNQHRLKRQVCDFFSSRNPIIISHRITHRTKNVLERLDEIAAERTKFHLAQASVSARHYERETNSTLIDSKVLGRDDDLNSILNFLNHEGNDKEISVLSIVGLGGIGKTTLAKLAYNDDRIETQFDLKIWVCVSDEFDVKEITRKIIECINKKTCDNLQFEPLSKVIQDVIGGKRFFLVLDDVWNEDHGKWERLISLLRCGKNGSKIVVTTRSEVVANVMDNVSLHHLKVLSTEDCWTLFRERAFGLHKERETPKLIEIGKDIVKKCGGLPLAAKTLGSLMRTKNGEFEWLAIQDSEEWKLTKEENNILPALKLSYNHLPSHLKQCFIYCSLFPKDYVFDKNELISLWISEGFVPSSDKNICLEDIGNEYFNNLLWRSFFQDVVKDDFDDRITCKIHDLVQELAYIVGKDEFSVFLFRKDIKLHDNCRYLSLVIDSLSPDIIEISTEMRKLRSLILLGTYSVRTKKVNLDLIVQIRHLRLLNLSKFSISVLPSTISKLKHLRFLDLSETTIETLPSSIGLLYSLSALILSQCYRLKELPTTINHLVNLYTLDLSHCDHLVELPSGTSNMNMLRHLDLFRCNALSGMPHGMGRLTNLQTLSRYVVGEEEGCQITELQHLNQIRGRLQVSNLRKVRNPRQAMEANLGSKIHLKQLDLYWDWGNRIEEANSEEEEVIEWLQPPPNIERLVIGYYMGVRWPSWMIMPCGSSSLFHNLTNIALRHLMRCECLPPLGQLFYLKHLQIWGMNSVRRIGGGGDEFYGGEVRGGNSVPFPLLKTFDLYSMSNLEEWLVETGDIKIEMMFPSLTELRVVGCPKLVTVQPGLPVTVENLEISEQILSIVGLAKLSRVRFLRISNCKISSSSVLWEGLHHLIALKSLEFFACQMTCLPVGLIVLHIPTLRSLEFVLCTELTSLSGIGGGDAQQQQQQPPLLFNNLHNLTLLSCTALTALPEWVGGLTTLQTLQIEDCPKLEMMPDGLQLLTALQQLIIQECSILERRCERETGEDWHKIAHIPNIQIIPCGPEEQQQQEAENSSSRIRRRRRRRSNSFSNFSTWIGGGLQSCL